MTDIRQDDKTIVKRILDNREPALREYYRTYYRPLSGFIRKRVDNEKDVEEIVQDTFIASLDALRDFSFRSALFTFLCGIAVHKVIDYYRRKKIRNIVFSRLPGVEDLLSTVLGPEDSLNEQILREKIKKTFSRLTPTYRLILELKYVQGYSVEEIARKLSISFKSAESQLFRARKAFAVEFAV